MLNIIHFSIDPTLLGSALFYSPKAVFVSHYNYHDKLVYYRDIAFSIIAQHYYFSFPTIG